MPSYDSLPDGDDCADADVVIEVQHAPRYFDINCSTLTDQTGSVIGELLVYRDVTERRNASKSGFRLIERSSDLVTIWTRTGLHVRQPAGRDDTRIRADEMVGENVVEYIHPDD